VKLHQNKWNDYIKRDRKKIKLRERGFPFADAIAVDLMLQ
jgi:hypothetical protein